MNVVPLRRPEAAGDEAVDVGPEFKDGDGGGGDDTYVVEVEMAEEDCAACSIPFLVPEAYQRRRMKDGATFWCPNGHGVRYAGPERPEPALRRETAWRLLRRAFRAPLW